MSLETVIHIVIALASIMVTGIGGYFAARVSTVRALATVQTDIEWIKSSRTERDKTIEELLKRVDRLEAGILNRAVVIPPNP